jgi:hypothetical protein
MTNILSEQMRAWAKSLEEAVHEDLPSTGLKGSLNPKQLADLLGIDDLALFTRSINKVKRGDTDKLTRMEMTELAVAFVNLLAADTEQTTKAMAAIRRVSSKDSEI